MEKQGLLVVLTFITAQIARSTANLQPYSPCAEAYLQVNNGAGEVPRISVFSGLRPSSPSLLALARDHSRRALSPGADTRLSIVEVQTAATLPTDQSSSSSDSNSSSSVPETKLDAVWRDGWYPEPTPGVSLLWDAARLLSNSNTSTTSTTSSRTGGSKLRRLLLSSQLDASTDTGAQAAVGPAAAAAAAAVAAASGAAGAAAGSGGSGGRGDVRVQVLGRSEFALQALIRQHAANATRATATGAAATAAVGSATAGAAAAAAAGRVAEPAALPYLAALNRSAAATGRLPEQLLVPPPGQPGGPLANPLLLLYRRDWWAALTGANGSAAAGADTADDDPTAAAATADAAAAAAALLPRTWPQLVSLAAALLNRDLDGDGRADHVLCLDLSRGCKGWALLSAIHASLAQTNGTAQGLWFRSADISPTLGGPALRTSLQLYAALAALNAAPFNPSDASASVSPGERNLSLGLNLSRSTVVVDPAELAAGGGEVDPASGSPLCGGVNPLFAAGRCLFTLDWATAALRITRQGAPGVYGNLGASILPGSSFVRPPPAPHSATPPASPSPSPAYGGGAAGDTGGSGYDNTSAADGDGAVLQMLTRCTNATCPLAEVVLPGAAAAVEAVIAAATASAAAASSDSSYGAASSAGGTAGGAAAAAVAASAPAPALLVNRAPLVGEADNVWVAPGDLSADEYIRLDDFIRLVGYQLGLKYAALLSLRPTSPPPSPSSSPGAASASPASSSAAPGAPTAGLGPSVPSPGTSPASCNASSNSSSGGGSAGSSCGVSVSSGGYGAEPSPVPGGPSVALQLDPGDLQQVLQAVHASVQHPNVAMDILLPYSSSYRAVLDSLAARAAVELLQPPPGSSSQQAQAAAPGASASTAPDTAASAATAAEGNNPGRRLAAASPDQGGWVADGVRLEQDVGLAGFDAGTSARADAMIAEAVEGFTNVSRAFSYTGLLLRLYQHSIGAQPPIDPGAADGPTGRSGGAGGRRSVPVPVVAGVTSAAVVGAALLGCAAAAWVLVARQRRERQLREPRNCAKPPGPGPATTLALTDVQNSTLLWEMLPSEAMDACMSIHHVVIRQSIAAHGGYEAFTEGDAFAVAFHSPEDALGFALEVQMALLVADWPTELLDHPDGCEVWARRNSHLQLQLLLPVPYRISVAAGPAAVASGAGGASAAGETLSLAVLAAAGVSGTSTGGPAGAGPGGLMPPGGDPGPAGIARLTAGRRLRQLLSGTSARRQPPGSRPTAHECSLTPSLDGRASANTTAAGLYPAPAATADIPALPTAPRLPPHTFVKNHPRFCGTPLPNVSPLSVVHDDSNDNCVPSGAAAASVAATASASVPSDSVYGTRAAAAGAMMAAVPQTAVPSPPGITKAGWLSRMKLGVAGLSRGSIEVVTPQRSRHFGSGSQELPWCGRFDTTRSAASLTSRLLMSAKLAQARGSSDARVGSDPRATSDPRITFDPRASSDPRVGADRTLDRLPSDLDCPTWPVSMPAPSGAAPQPSVLGMPPAAASVAAVGPAPRAPSVPLPGSRRRLGPGAQYSKQPSLRRMPTNMSTAAYVVREEEGCASVSHITITSDGRDADSRTSDERLGGASGRVKSVRFDEAGGAGAGAGSTGSDPAGLLLFGDPTATTAAAAAAAVPALGATSPARLDSGPLAAAWRNLRASVTFNLRSKKRLRRPSGSPAPTSGNQSPRALPGCGYPGERESGDAAGESRETWRGEGPGFVPAVGRCGTEIMPQPLGGSQAYRGSGASRMPGAGGGGGAVAVAGAGAGGGVGGDGGTGAGLTAGCSDESHVSAPMHRQLGSGEMRAADLWEPPPLTHAHAALSRLLPPPPPPQLPASQTQALAQPQALPSAGRRSEASGTAAYGEPSLRMPRCPAPRPAVTGLGSCPAVTGLGSCPAVTGLGSCPAVTGLGSRPADIHSASPSLGSTQASAANVHPPPRSPVSPSAAASDLALGLDPADNNQLVQSACRTSEAARAETAFRLGGSVGSVITPAVASMASVTVTTAVQQGQQEHGEQQQQQQQQQQDQPQSPRHLALSWLLAAGDADDESRRVFPAESRGPEASPSGVAESVGTAQVEPSGVAESVGKVQAEPWPLPAFGASEPKMAAVLPELGGQGGASRFPGNTTTTATATVASYSPAKAPSPQSRMLHHHHQLPRHQLHPQYQQHQQQQHHQQLHQNHHHSYFFQGSNHQALLRAVSASASSRNSAGANDRVSSFQFDLPYTAYGRRSGGGDGGEELLVLPLPPTSSLVNTIVGPDSHPDFSLLPHSPPPPLQQRPQKQEPPLQQPQPQPQPQPGPLLPPQPQEQPCRTPPPPAPAQEVVVRGSPASAVVVTGPRRVPAPSSAPLPARRARALASPLPGSPPSRRPYGRVAVVRGASRLSLSSSEDPFLEPGSWDGYTGWSSAASAAAGGATAGGGADSPRSCIPLVRAASWVARSRDDPSFAAPAGGAGGGAANTAMAAAPVSPPLRTQSSCELGDGSQSSAGGPASGGGLMLGRSMSHSSRLLTGTTFAASSRSSLTRLRSYGSTQQLYRPSEGSRTAPVPYKPYSPYTPVLQQRPRAALPYLPYVQPYGQQPDHNRGPPSRTLSADARALPPYAYVRQRSRQLSTTPQLEEITEGLDDDRMAPPSPQVAGPDEPAPTPSRMSSNPQLAVAAAQHSRPPDPASAAPFSLSPVSVATAAPFTGAGGDERQAATERTERKAAAFAGPSGAGASTLSKGALGREVHGARRDAGGEARGREAGEEGRGCREGAHARVRDVEGQRRQPRRPAVEAAPVAGQAGAAAGATAVATANGAGDWLGPKRSAAVAAAIRSVRPTGSGGNQPLPPPPACRTHDSASPYTRTTKAMASDSSYRAGGSVAAATAAAETAGFASEGHGGNGGARAPAVQMKLRGATSEAACRRQHSPPGSGRSDRRIIDASDSDGSNDESALVRQASMMSDDVDLAPSMEIDRVIESTINDALDDALDADSADPSGQAGEWRNMITWSEEDMGDLLAVLQPPPPPLPPPPLPPAAAAAVRHSPIRQQCSGSGERPRPQFPSPPPPSHPPQPTSTLRSAFPVTRSSTGKTPGLGAGAGAGAGAGVGGGGGGGAPLGSLHTTPRGPGTPRDASAQELSPRRALLRSRLNIASVAFLRDPSPGGSGGTGGTDHGSAASGAHITASSRQGAAAQMEAGGSLAAAQQRSPQAPRQRHASVVPRFLSMTSRDAKGAGGDGLDTTSNAQHAACARVSQVDVWNVAGAAGDDPNAEYFSDDLRRSSPNITGTSEGMSNPSSNSSLLARLGLGHILKRSEGRRTSATGPPETAGDESPTSPPLPLTVHGGQAPNRQPPDVVDAGDASVLRRLSTSARQISDAAAGTAPVVPRRTGGGGGGANAALASVSQPLPYASDAAALTHRSPGPAATANRTDPELGRIPHVEYGPTSLDEPSSGFGGGTTPTALGLANATGAPHTAFHGTLPAPSPGASGRTSYICSATLSMGRLAEYLVGNSSNGRRTTLVQRQITPSLTASRASKGFPSPRHNSNHHLAASGHISRVLATGASLGVVGGVGGLGGGAGFATPGEADGVFDLLWRDVNAAASNLTGGNAGAAAGIGRGPWPLEPSIGPMIRSGGAEGGAGGRGSGGGGGFAVLQCALATTVSSALKLLYDQLSSAEMALAFLMERGSSARAQGRGDLPGGGGSAASIGALGAQQADPELVFRGLRVRVGLHSGPREGEVEMSLVDRLMVARYGGEFLAACREVGDTPAGGLIVLSGAAFRSLQQHRQQLRPQDVMVLHLGDHLMRSTACTAAIDGDALAIRTSGGRRVSSFSCGSPPRRPSSSGLQGPSPAAASPTRELYTAVTPELLPRLALLPSPIRTAGELVPGCLSAPAGVVAPVFCNVVGVEALMAWEALLHKRLLRAAAQASAAGRDGLTPLQQQQSQHQQHQQQQQQQSLMVHGSGGAVGSMTGGTQHGMVRSALELFRGLAKARACALGGYVVASSSDSGHWVLVFGSPEAAVRWGLDMLEAMLEADWPEEFLEHELTEEVWEGDTLLKRGLRLRIGVDCGQAMIRLVPRTGRLDYVGRPMNRAARITAKAKAASILVSNAAWAVAKPALGPLVSPVSLGQVQLKGIREPLELWAVKATLHRKQLQQQRQWQRQQSPRIQQR